MKLVLMIWFALVAMVSTVAARPRLEFAARQGRVTVFTEDGLERLGKQMAARADTTLDRISEDLAGLPAPALIEIRVVRDTTDLAAIAPADRGAPPWAVGVAYPDLGIISIATHRNGTPTDPIATLRHELAHVALGAALGTNAPHWLHEGFAYQHSGEWSRERYETLAGMAWVGSIIPLDQLDRSFPREELPAHRAYAESYDFVGFLARRGRWEDTDDDGNRWPFRRFLGELSRGATVDQAAMRSFGRPLKLLFEEWRHDLNKRYMLAPLGLLGLAMWIIVGLLLAVAWWRRKHQNRRRIAQWDLEDAARHERERSQLIVAPPYVAWPGEDPLAEEPEDEPPPDPRLMN
ncbi:MAG: hypothetical protein WKG01_10435 [Kofleriaceae bacterium]